MEYGVRVEVHDGNLGAKWLRSCEHYMDISLFYIFL